MEPYAGSVEHLRHELTRLDRMLHRAVLVARARMKGAEQADFRGLVISEGEIDAMSPLDVLGDLSRAESALRSELEPIDAEIAQMRDEIDQRIAVTHAAGRALRLVSLARAFALSQAEVDLLLIAVAPELEPRYETLYAYLHNDVTRKRPSVDLCLNVICRDADEKLAARRFFSDDAALLRFALIDLIDESYDRQPTLLRRFLKTRDAVVHVLLEQPSPPELGATDSGVPDDANDVSVATSDMIRTVAASAPSGVIHLSSTSSDALRAASRLLAHELGRPILQVGVAELDEQPWSKVAALARDTHLEGSLLVVRGSTETRDGDPAAKRRDRARRNLAALATAARPPLVIAGLPQTASDVPPALDTWHIDVEPAEYATRLGVWDAALRDSGGSADAPRLADTFHFNADRIRQTAALARSIAVLRDPADPRPMTDDFLQAGRALTAPDLSRYAIRIEPRYDWNDLVLGDEKLRQLRGIAARVKHRRVVHRDWGFGRKLSRGKGVSVLFSGPSGTGKTMAAEVLANELSVDLFQIDLSAVVSKYIGETERNLFQIFEAAGRGQCLLFFDEADALYGKRTEVKDAHDRYANIEVDYLLQRMEQYSGPVVLATNFQKNIDDAFLRRLHDIVEFPFPDDSARARIWQQHFPSEAPRESDIDYAFLSRFSITGGSIRNIVLNAAFLAAQEQSPIAMRHLVQSLRGDFQKQGKLIMKADLGPYAEAV